MVAGRALARPLIDEFADPPSGRDDVRQQPVGVSSQASEGGDRWAFSRDSRGALQGQRKLTDDGVGERYYYLTDAQGSVIAVTDEDGDVKARYGYDPFGVTRGSEEEGVRSPWRWQGQYLDGQTGLYKMGERYYAPTQAGDVAGEVTLYNRWTQVDPLNQFQDPRQNNRYLYAGQDPVNFADPSGRRSVGDFLYKGAVTYGTCLGAVGSGILTVTSAPTGVGAVGGGAVTAGVGIGCAANAVDFDTTYPEASPAYNVYSYLTG